MPMIVEQRQHPRLKPENTFVISQKRVCRVFDISAGGLSFGCIDENEIPQESKVDIIDNYGSKLFDLPIETVWTARNTDLNTESIYKIIMGIKFRSNLSHSHRSTISELMNKLSSGIS